MNNFLRSKKIVAISLTAFAAAFFLFVHYFSPGNDVIFDIRDGMTGIQIAKQLKKQKIIKNETWFRLVLKISGSTNKLRSGRFKLREHMSSEEVIFILVKRAGTVLAIVTIPEGWRLEQIAERLENQKITPKEEFIQMAKERKLEGYLFPSTYYLQEKMQTTAVIDAMLKEFDKRIRPLLNNRQSGDIKEIDILTLASIVEREAVVHTERPLIAAVYLNRVKKGMKLQADPTVQYALGYNTKQQDWWKKNLNYDDLKKNSPYNTYMYEGLPPGPICNPGIYSVEAVLNPAQFDALYFVSDNKGQHIFNISFNEHLAAIKRIRGK